MFPDFNYKNEVKQNKTFMKNCKDIDEDETLFFLNDPHFLEQCKINLDNDISIVNDLKKQMENKKYLKIDQNFIDSFLQYFSREGPDYVDILEIVLPKNELQLIENGLMKLLIKKAPNSFYFILNILNAAGGDALRLFWNDSGYYSIALFSNDPNYQIVISHILYLTILDIPGYSDYFTPPIEFEDLISNNDIDYPDMSPITLVANLINSENVDVVLETLRSLELAFENNVEACVVLGTLIVRNEYLNHFIQDPQFAIQYVKTLSAGALSIPTLDKSTLLKITETLLESENDILIEAGIKLSCVLFRKTEEDKIAMKTTFGELKDTQIIPHLFHLSDQDTAFKLRISALKAIDILLQNCLSSELQLLFNAGLIQLFKDIFVDDPQDSLADKEIILISLSILSETLRKATYASINEENFNLMCQYYDYLGKLRFNSDETIAEQANQAYIKLSIFYASNADFNEEK